MQRVLFFIFIVFPLLLFSQQKTFVLIDKETQKQYVKKDSLSAVKFLDSLVEKNYYFAKILSVTKENSKTSIWFDKGKNYNQAFVKVTPEVSKEFSIPTDFLTKNLDSLKQVFHQNRVDKGFSFSRIKTKYLGLKNDIPWVELSVYQHQQRKIDGFVVKGYDKVPKRFIKNLEKEFNQKIYGNKNLLSLQKALQSHPFVALERPPQTLFTKDSTDIYLFLRKKKSNSFDGVLGFGNDKSEKFTINGTLDVNFRNLFNGFEAISLFWQRNPDSGQNFDLKVDVPYVLGSNVGINLQTNIYKQDSTYANFKFRPSVYYHLSNRQKLGVRGNLETSTVTQTSFTEGKDYNKTGIGLWYDFTEPTEIELFRHRTRILAEASYMSVFYQADDQTASQKYYFLSAERNLHLTGNHYINLRGESAFLQSQLAFTTNELLRLGGWNSLRGFNESSLLGNFYYYGTAEYRYLIGNQAFFDIFGQYGQMDNKNLKTQTQLYSVGLGFHFFLPIGLMSFQISNGNPVGNPIKFSDTKIHWGILAKF
ncbi:MAG: hypothetical protein JSS94_07960 [Bacteroidetes bacterium]|nr:hypothetical protein [Bacteroidota bacterium]